MNIAKILELQSLYGEAAKITKDFEESDINRKYQKVKDIRNAAKVTIQDILRQADEYQNALQMLSKQIEEVSEAAKEIGEAEYDGIDNEELADEKTALEDCKKQISALLSKTDGTKAALQNLFRKFSQAATDYKKVDAERNLLKPQFEALSLKTKQEFDAVNEKIKALKSSMAESDVALYENTKASTGKAKAFFELVGTSCSGCGMTLDPSAYQKIESDGFGKCPNCGCVLFSKQQ